MLKVAKLSEGPEQSLIPPFREVNADDTANKFPSRTTVQLVTQSRTPTDRMTKKRRIPPSSKPKSPYKVRVILPKKQVTETQHTEVTEATADVTKSLASESAEEQGNQPSTAEAEKLTLKTLDFDGLTHPCMKVDLCMDYTYSDSEVPLTNEKRNDVSHSDHIFQDDNASAERLSLPNHMDHICEEVSSLHSKLGDMESSIIHQVSAEIKSSLPALVTTALQEQLPGLLSATLKDCLPSIL
ncbi:hypothetical protein Tco_0733582 [Tanacetum coccineum]